MFILLAFNFWYWYARFIIDIYKTEEREESKQFINKICLEFPKVFLWHLLTQYIIACKS
jgi:hypothetical protein